MWKRKCDEAVERVQEQNIYDLQLAQPTTTPLPNSKYKYRDMSFSPAKEMEWSGDIIYIMY